MDPAGRVAVVTGGGSRLGRAITLGLARAGADVVVHYHRSADAADETAAAARALGQDALVVQADLSSVEQAQALGEAAEEAFGGVDILVHTSSPFIAGRLEDVTPASWQLVMGVVVKGLLFLTQRLAPGMRQRGEGAIITVLDRGASEPWPSFLVHGVAKSALWALTRSLAVELAPQVRVNGLVPGPVLPPPDYGEEQIARRAQGTLLERWGDPQDVVDAVLFLVRSDYVTGEALFLDGGERWAHRRGSRG
jgi:NAD(P)-dependent dehydrogenase (short-subunit alcohol dehydrogenase family)